MERLFENNRAWAAAMHRRDPDYFADFAREQDPRYLWIGCGGVQAALDAAEFGLIDNWLRHVQDMQYRHHEALDGLPAEARARRLCELNVIEQVVNVCHTTIVRRAWERGQDLGVGRTDDLAECYDVALRSLAA